jgi:hypothetical protein
LDRSLIATQGHVVNIQLQTSELHAPRHRVAGALLRQ